MKRGTIKAGWRRAYIPLAAPIPPGLAPQATFIAEDLVHLAKSNLKVPFFFRSEVESFSFAGTSKMERFSDLVPVFEYFKLLKRVNVRILKHNYDGRHEYILEQIEGEPALPKRWWKSLGVTQLTTKE